MTKLKEISAMRIFFTLLTFSIASSSFAQVNHYIDFQTGISIPALEFANNSTIYTQNGFAKTGVHLSSSYTPMFRKLFAPKAMLFFGHNPFDENAFLNGVEEYYEADLNNTITDFRAYSYSVFGLAVGPGFKVGGEKLFARFNVLLAIVNQSHPELRTEGIDLSDMKDWSDVLVQTNYFSYGGMAELSLYKQVSDRLVFSLNTSVFGSPFSFSQNGSFKKSGENTRRYTRLKEGEINNVNISAGISWMLHQPKQLDDRPVIF